MMESNQNSKVIWIGDLDTWMDEGYLQNLVGSLGYSKELSSIKLIRDKGTGLPLKYGFIEFINHDTANNFYLNYKGRTIPNTTKQFKLNWASYGGGTKPGSINPSKNNDQDMQIYVGDIDTSITEHKLLELFRMRYPSAFNAKVITDNQTKISKGYGFVKFTNHEEAHKAIAEMNGHNFMGKNLKVSTAHLKPKEETQAQNQQSQNQLLLRQRLYAQFYSMINDPQVKAEYEKQVQKTFGNQEGKKPTLKQSLEGVRSLSYAETLDSMKMLEIIPKAVSNSHRSKMQQRIYQ